MTDRQKGASDTSGEKTRRAVGDAVACPKCDTDRPMVLKTIHPALIGRDTMTYRCTACGAELTEILA